MKNSPETLKKRNEKKREWKRKTDLSSIPKYKKRVCNTCGKVRPCKFNSSFTAGSGVAEYKAKCDLCWNKYQAGLSKNPARKLKRNKKRSIKARKRKEIAVKRLGGKCKECGYDKTIAGLTFHHTKDKKYTVSTMIDKPFGIFIKEVDKCILLCWNCHMELHGKE